MSRVTIHTGRSAKEMLEQMGQDFVRTWNKAERGERTGEEVHLRFPIETLAAVTSEKRIEVLRHLRVHPEPSITALARNLKRDYRRVHDDVKILLDAGLVMKHGGMLSAPYGEFSVNID